MPCILILILLGLPRVALLLLFFGGTYLGNAYAGNFWPAMGFLFMPWTTLAYAWSVNTYGSVTGLGTVVLILGVLFDLGMLGASRRKRRAAQG
jgi:hypothetical protein